MIGPSPAAPAPRDLDAERRRFVRRVLGAAALIAPLFLALGWWTSRSFLLRETRFNQLSLEVQMPRRVPHGLGVPVRFVTRDPLGRAHRAQVKWVARDAAGVELLRGAVDSPGTHEVLLPAEVADIARLEVRASDGAWGRNATIDVPRRRPAAEVALASFPSGAAPAEIVLLAQRAPADESSAAAVFVAFDPAGVPIARRAVAWSGAFALARWSGRAPDAVARRFEVQDAEGEVLAQLDLVPAPAPEPSREVALELLDEGIGVRVVAQLGASEEAELVWFDAERVHARQMLRGGERSEVELRAVAPLRGSSFVRLTAREGQGIALWELPSMAEGPLRARASRGASAAELVLELLDPRSAPVAGTALTLAVAPPEATSGVRAIEAQALGYFGASVSDRARLGYGQLAVLHSSSAERVALIAAREREELLARRIVFGTAMALAALCSLVWIFFLLRHRSAAIPPAWRLGFGGTALALVFALVASKLWWGSEGAEVSTPLVGAEVEPRLEHGPLEPLAPSALSALEVAFALCEASDAEGRARLAAPAFAAAQRVQLWITTARGLQRVALDVAAR